MAARPYLVRFFIPEEREVAIRLIALFRAGSIDPDHDEKEEQGEAEVQAVLREQIDELVQVILLCFFERLPRWLPGRGRNGAAAGNAANLPDPHAGRVIRRSLCAGERWAANVEAGWRG